MSTVGQSGPTHPDPRSAATLVADMARLVGRLVLDEFALAGAEIGQSARTLVGAVMLIAAAAGFVFAGLLALLAAVVAAFALIMPVWKAAIVTCLGALLIGGALAFVGQLIIRRIEVIPSRTRRSLAETTAWMKEIVD